MPSPRSPAKTRADRGHVPTLQQGRQYTNEWPGERGTNKVAPASRRPSARAGRPLDSRQDAGATNLAWPDTNILFTDPHGWCSNGRIPAASSFLASSFLASSFLMDNGLGCAFPEKAVELRSTGQ